MTSELLVQDVYNNSVSQKDGGELKSFDPITIFIIISTIIGLLIQLATWWQNRKADEIQFNLKNMGWFGRLMLRRQVRKAIILHRESVKEYANPLMEGLIKTFTTNSAAAIDEALEDFRKQIGVAS